MSGGRGGRGSHEVVVMAVRDDNEVNLWRALVEDVERGRHDALRRGEQKKSMC